MASTTKNYALISVSDKRGIVKFAAGLVEQGYKLLASGGTASALKNHGLEVTRVSDVTKTAAMLDGRVKTLHPNVHGAILARGDEDHMTELKTHGITPIDVVVCNLYPFEKTVAQDGVTFETAIENIDIGGVALLRAAAKNNSRVVVITDPTDYQDILKEMEAHSVGEERRKQLALKAFLHTSHYDTAISSYFLRQQQCSPQHRILRYGMNPHQTPAVAYTSDSQLPFTVLSGSPGFINLCDGLNAWQLVKELRIAVGRPAAASFKHLTPAGAAVASPLLENQEKVYMVENMKDLSDIALAYVRARGADRMSSFGDFIALSDECDAVTAQFIQKEVSDGIIAPSYSPEALAILKEKKGGKYCVLQMDPDYSPPELESRTVHGVTLRQKKNDALYPIEEFEPEKIGQQNAINLAVASVAVKFAQSNSVCFVHNGQVVGMGAGQQSRIHCTRLAADKCDNWWLRHHEKVLNLKFKRGVKRTEKSNLIDNFITGYLDVEKTGDILEEKPVLFSEQERKDWISKLKNVTVASDAFFPFRDSIDRAKESGVECVVSPLGSQNDEIVQTACKEHGIKFFAAKARLFHH